MFFMLARAQKDCFASLHFLAKSPFVKTSGDRRYSAFLPRIEPSYRFLRLSGTVRIEKTPKRVFLEFVARPEGFEPSTF